MLSSTNHTQNSRMKTSQKRKHEESEWAEEKADVDLSSVDLQWTPERNQRAITRSKKVRSADDGPLMGGDWVLNEEGGGATLSFCFKNPEGTECYGLSVGHLTQSVGDSIFRFAESEPIAVLNDENDKEEYFMFEIGNVTSISTGTDSMVFKMNLEDDQYDPLRIALSDQSHITLNKNLLSLAKVPTKKFSLLAGFGAQRRGARCMVRVPSKDSPSQHSFVGDIGLESASQSSFAATDGGDCGAIFCSIENGAPVCVHHVLSQYSDNKKISYGVPLLKILAAHKETRHLIPASHEVRKSAPEDKTEASFICPYNEGLEVADLRQFQTRVVDRPHNAISKYASPTKEMNIASLRSLETGGDDGKENQTLPVFNIRIRQPRLNGG